MAARSPRVRPFARYAPAMVAAWGLCGLASPQRALAQTVPQPPQVQYAPPLAPVPGLAPGDPDRVVSLRLEICEQGEVVGVQPLNLEEPFVAAAIEAALGMRFFPASAEGQAVASRLRYRFVFRAPQVEQAPIVVDPPIEKSPAAPELSEEVVDIVEVQATVEVPATTQQEQSAQAVQSQSMVQARAQSSDLGRALRRSRGMSFQQSAGLGSRMRVMMAGYTGPQVRYFFDGLPLAWSGYARRISAISAQEVQRIDVHEGVVPVQLGTDALGGALHLIGRKVQPGLHGRLSYELGSFGNHRAQAHFSAANRRHRFSLYGGYDHAQNRYPMQIEVPNDKGQMQAREVYRFHDAYRAQKLRVAWRYARKFWDLELIAFGQRLRKELQSNLVMSVPFGEAGFERDRAGLVTRLNVRTKIALRASLDLGVKGLKVHLSDIGTCRYDWFGRCVRDNGIQGEIGQQASDQTLRQFETLVIPRVTWNIADNHNLVLSSLLSSVHRRGKDAALPEDQLDPLDTPRTLFSTSTGLAYRALLWKGRLANDLFGKLHTQNSYALDYGVSTDPIHYRSQDQAWGWGNALRLGIVEGLQIKASYEWSARMPSADERFGDGILVQPNLKLTPERSHNLNLSTTFERDLGRPGSFKLSARGYLRQGRDLILLLGTPVDLRYRNMMESQVKGVQASLDWRFKKDLIGLSTHWTFQRPENRSPDGDFKDYEGDRIPNQPYRWGHAQLTLGWPELLFEGDRISGFFGVRWVGEFFRAWESLGLASTKDRIPAQTTLSTGLIYRLAQMPRVFSLSFRVDNLSSAQVFDFFGVPRPGRSFATKIHFEI